jgi:hypothetical protein
MVPVFPFNERKISHPERESKDKNLRENIFQVLCIVALTTHPPSSAEVKESVQLYLYSPLDLKSVNFTFAVTVPSA